MKHFTDYIFEVSDELLRRAADSAKEKSKDGSLSKDQRRIKGHQAKEFEDYLNSKDRKRSYKAAAKHDSIKNMFKNGIKVKSDTELAGCIRTAIKYNHLDLNFIDVSGLTKLNYVLDQYILGLDVPEGIDVSKWDVSNVTDMHDMFAGCKTFNCDISKWDVSNVTDMTRMFEHCHSFNQNLTKWNVDKVKKWDDIFYDCKIIDNNKPEKFLED